MQEFKKSGIVRAIGASTKTVEGGIKTVDLMDVVMATYTADHEEEKPVLDHAALENKNVILMVTQWIHNYTVAHFHKLFD